MKAFLNILTSLLILVIFGGCEKGPELTPITQDGRNTFSCKVNGKVWVAERTPDLARPKEAIYGGFTQPPGIDTINIFLRAYRPDGTGIDLYLRSIKIGVHHLNANSSPYSIYPQPYGSYYSTEKILFITATGAIGSVKISKADVKTGLLAGTFEFEAVTSSGEIVKVSDGRFDIKSPL